MEGEWVTEENVACVVAPCCAFTFAAYHTNADDDGYSCPSCAEMRLRAGLKDAIECVREWSAYASDYFKEKWDLEGDIARLEAALSGDRLSVGDGT